MRQNRSFADSNGSRPIRQASQYSSSSASADLPSGNITNRAPRPRSARENGTSCRRLIGACLVLTLSPFVSPAVFAQSSSILQANTIVTGGETRPAAAALRPASAITIEAWITAPTAVINYPAFVSYGIDDAEPYESYILQADTIDGTHPADFFFLTGTGSPHQVFGTTNLAAGAQYFLVATYNGTSAKLYVNGVLEGSVAASGSLYYPGGGLGLGRPYNRPDNNFSGIERGAAIYSTALSASQIAAQYAAGPPMPVFSRSQVTSPSTVVASSALQPTSAFTVSTWINSPTTLTNYPAFVSYGQDTDPYESYILQAQTIDGATPADLYFLTGTGTYHALSGTTHLQTGTQYQLVATYNGTTAKIYVNGVLESSVAASGALYYPGGGLGLAGKYSDAAANFTGMERGVAIYGAALSADRIAAQFQAGSPPTIPSGVTATAASGTQVNLSWASSSDAVSVSGYLIERCQGISCTDFQQIANSTGTSYSDSGLTAATAYSYRSRAVNAGNNVSDYSSTASATTSGGGGDTTPPTAPTGLMPTPVSSSQLNLSWTASTDNVAVSGYLVERCQGASCSNFVQVGTSASTTFADSGLSASTSYSYRVRATDAASNLSSYSSTATASTQSTGGSGGDVTSPSAPTSLSATAVSSNRIDLTWTASTDNIGVTGYQVESCQGTSCTIFTQIGTPTSTAFSATGLTALTSYSFRVLATDAAGNLSGYSNVVSASPSAGGQLCD
jgi:chitodextrinase